MPPVVKNNDDNEFGAVNRMTNAALRESQEEAKAQDNAIKYLQQSLQSVDEISPTQGIAAALLAAIPTIGGYLIGKRVGEPDIPEGTFGMSMKDLATYDTGADAGVLSGAQTGEDSALGYLTNIEKANELKNKQRKEMSDVELAKSRDAALAARQLEYGALSNQAQMEQQDDRQAFEQAQANRNFGNQKALETFKTDEELRKLRAQKEEGLNTGRGANSFVEITPELAKALNLSSELVGKVYDKSVIDDLRISAFNDPQNIKERKKAELAEKLTFLLNKQQAGLNANGQANVKLPVELYQALGVSDEVAQLAADQPLTPDLIKSIISNDTGAIAARGMSKEGVVTNALVDRKNQGVGADARAAAASQGKMIEITSPAMAQKFNLPPESVGQTISTEQIKLYLNASAQQNKKEIDQQTIDLKRTGEERRFNDQRMKAGKMIVPGFYNEAGSLPSDSQIKEIVNKKGEAIELANLAGEATKSDTGALFGQESAKAQVLHGLMMNAGRNFTGSGANFTEQEIQFVKNIIPTFATDSFYQYLKANALGRDQTEKALFLQNLVLKLADYDIAQTYGQFSLSRPLVAYPRNVLENAGILPPRKVKPGEPYNREEFNKLNSIFKKAQEDDRARQQSNSQLLQSIIAPQPSE